MNSNTTLTTLIAAAALTAVAVAMPVNAKAEAPQAKPQASQNELPSDWVWQKKAVNFDGMYRR